MSAAVDDVDVAADPVVTQHSAWSSLVITGLVIGAAFIAVYVGLQRNPSPIGLPIAVVGKKLSAALHAGFGKSVAVTEVADARHGQSMVRDEDAVAVVRLVTPNTIELDYAGASGASESGAARQLVAGLAGRLALTLHEKDIVPLTHYDARGLSAFYVVFGVTLSSFVLAQGLTAVTAIVRLRHRLYAMAGFAIAIGVIAATIAGPVYGSLTAPFVPLAISLVLLSAASAFATKALGAWLGPPGIGLAVLVLTTVGNATSGATIGSHLLPSWAHTISPLLPPGAAVRAVGNFGYFNGAHTAVPLCVLSLWFVTGLGLVLLRRRIGRNA